LRNLNGFIKLKIYNKVDNIKLKLFYEYDFSFDIRKLINNYQINLLNTYNN